MGTGGSSSSFNVLFIAIIICVCERVTDASLFFFLN